MIEAIVLGCGTSHGVPTIGCRCNVCHSSDPKNKRTRSGIVIRSITNTVLFDAPPELRLQLVREQIDSIDSVVITHSHADHIMGLDDLRSITEKTGTPMPIYGQPNVLEDIRRVFNYAFIPPTNLGGGLPAFDLRPAPSPLIIGNLTFNLFEVLHGNLPVLGLRIGDFAYLTDVSEIPETVFPRLSGLQTLILDATRIAPHPSHFHLEKAVEVSQRLKPAQTYLTHLSHDYDYEATNAALPTGIELSFDGLRISIQP